MATFQEFVAFLLQTNSYLLLLLLTQVHLQEWQFLFAAPPRRTAGLLFSLWYEAELCGIKQNVITPCCYYSH